MLQRQFHPLHILPPVRASGGDPVYTSNRGSGPGRGLLPYTAQDAIACIDLWRTRFFPSPHAHRGKHPRKAPTASHDEGRAAICLSSCLYPSSSSRTSTHRYYRLVVLCTGVTSSLLFSLDRKLKPFLTRTPSVTLFALSSLAARSSSTTPSPSTSSDYYWLNGFMNGIKPAQFCVSSLTSCYATHHLSSTNQRSV